MASLGAELRTKPSRRAEGPTLADALGSSDNALNSIRLGLALAVIVGHAFPLGGFAPVALGPFVHGGLHGWAVDGFFVISGYLIFASGMRTSALGYLWRRALRIYPAYLVAIVATAFIAAPIGAAIESGARWEWRSAAGYVLGALDLKPSQEGVLSTLIHVPWPGTWNGSLWTLFYEAAAYLGVALLCAWGPVRSRLTRIVPPAAIAATIAFVALPPGFLEARLPGALGVIAGNGLRLWTFFAWGMVAYLLRDRLRPTAGIAWVTAFVFLLVVHIYGLPHWVVTALALPSLTVAILFAGALLPWRFGNRTDLSYGTYVYAFPVQQLLILLGIAQHGRLVSSMACVVLTLPLAWLSWHCVERPSLRMKGLIGALPRSYRPPSRYPS